MLSLLLGFKEGQRIRNSEFWLTFNDSWVLKFKEKRREIYLCGKLPAKVHLSKQWRFSSHIISWSKLFLYPGFLMSPLLIFREKMLGLCDLYCIQIYEELISLTEFKDFYVFFYFGFRIVSVSKCDLSHPTTTRLRQEYF